MKIKMYGIVDTINKNIVEGVDLDGNKIAMISLLKGELEDTLKRTESQTSSKFTEGWKVKPVTVTFDV
jgi:hypothetical protein